MIQNKKKLQEVGLEPDKPTGYVRGIWALTLILAFALVVVSGIFYILWSSPWGESSYWHRNLSNNETRDWQTYTNSTYTLAVKYPQDWGYREFNKDTGNDKDWRLAVSFYNPELKSAVESLEDSSLVFDIALYIYNTDQKAQFSAGGCTKEKDVVIAQKNGELDKCFSEMAAEYYYDYVAADKGKTFILESLKEKKDILDKMVKTIDFGAMTVLPSPSNL